MLKLAIIGLDTSHSIQFTKLLRHDGTPEAGKREDVGIMKCMRFESPFKTEDQQDELQLQLEKWGVGVSRSFDETVAGADGLLLEINDPAQHLKYFEMAAETGLPLFLDKPLAGNLEDAGRILTIAKEKNIKVWSSSALRFTCELENCIKCISQPIISNVFGPMGRAAVGSSFIWYGVHAFEMLGTIMGGDVESAIAHDVPSGIVTVVNYRDGRRAVVECNRKNRFYGARVQTETDIESFQVKSTDDIYLNLISRIRDFFVDGTIPVALEETFKIFAVISAAEKSLSSGKYEKIQT